MPDATISDEVIRKDLKSLKGAWVDLRPLPFGQMLERRDRASRMSMQTGQRGKDNKVDIDTMQTITRQYEFENCIVDHNLEDRAGVKLNFSNPATLRLLHPKVGGEIEGYIDELNQPDEDLEDFTSAPSDSLSQAAKPSMLTTEHSVAK